MGAAGAAGAYTPEMLLAAKLSWIVRHVRRDTAPERRPFLSFLGEPKDLFDVHLLLTTGRPRPEVFQNALLAVAAEDRLDWQRMDLLLDPELAPPEGVGAPDRSGTLRTVIERLGPLMGDLRRHLLFLRLIGENPSDEANLLIYADWLEDRRDPRADFLRLFCRWFFHEDAAARARAAAFLTAQPGGWLYHVFGGPERSREMRRRLGEPPG